MNELVPIIAPVFLCAGLGWAWVRLGRSYDGVLMSRLIADIGAPCLVFSRLTSAEIDSSVMAEVAGLAGLAIVTAGLAGFVALRVARLPLHTFLAPLALGNAGNMGLPLCLFALGEEGLALGICFFAVSALTQFTVGVWVWTGRISLAELMRTPLTYAVLLAAAVRYLQVPVPLWLANTTGTLGGFAIPLMLLTLGVSLSETRVTQWARTLVLSVLRLGVGFGTGLAICAAFELEGVARGVVLIQSSMPPAVFNYLMALRYSRSPEQVASLVVTSTLIAFAALPLLLKFVLRP